MMQVNMEEYAPEIRDVVKEYLKTVTVESSKVVESTCDLMIILN